jgi:hypothetical protein
MNSCELLTFLNYHITPSSDPFRYKKTRAFCPKYWKSMLPILGIPGKERSVSCKIDVTKERNIYEDRLGKQYNKTDIFESNEFKKLYQNKINEITENTGLGTIENIVETSDDGYDINYVVFSITPIYLLHCEYQMLKQLVEDVTISGITNNEEHTVTIRLTSDKIYSIDSYRKTSFTLLKLYVDSENNVKSQSTHFEDLIKQTMIKQNRNISVHFEKYEETSKIDTPYYALNSFTTYNVFCMIIKFHTRI